MFIVDGIDFLWVWCVLIQLHGTFYQKYIQQRETWLMFISRVTTITNIAKVYTDQ